MCAGGSELSLGGGILQAYGQYRAGRAAEAAANYEAAQLNASADLAEGEVAGVRLRGGAEVDRLRREGLQQVGAGRASYAGGNVDLSVGTPKFWELDAVKGIATDTGVTKFNTAQEENKLRTEAWNLRNQARLARFGGRNARIAGNIAATSTLLSSSGQYAKSYQAGG